MDEALTPVQTVHWGSLSFLSQIERDAYYSSSDGHTLWEGSQLYSALGISPNDFFVICHLRITARLFISISR